MAYLELTLEAYDNIIKAAGNRAASVSRVCEEQGVWEPKAEEEAPPDYVPVEDIRTEVQTELTLDDPEEGGTTYEPSADEDDA